MPPSAAAACALGSPGTGVACRMCSRGSGSDVGRSSPLYRRKAYSLGPGSEASRGHAGGWRLAVVRKTRRGACVSRPPAPAALLLGGGVGAGPSRGSASPSVAPPLLQARGAWGVREEESPAFKRR